MLIFWAAYLLIGVALAAMIDHVTKETNPMTVSQIIVHVLIWPFALVKGFVKMLNHDS